MTDAAKPVPFLIEEEPGESVVNLAASVDPLLSQWARFRDLFKEAMAENGFWTIEDLEQKIAHRRAFFFPGKSAALVGYIEVYPGGRKVFQSLWAVGDLQEIVAMIPGLESIGRMLGCDGILVEGRDGWERALEPLGYERWSVSLYKEL